MNLKKKLRKIMSPVIQSSPSPEIDTTPDRISYVTVALIGTTIAVAVGVYLGISSPTITHTIRGKTYTDAEYQQIKTSEINLIKNRATTSPTFEEAEIWKSIITQECGSITLHNVTQDTLVDQLNNYLSNGCKE